jgi:diguanylate cyclase (GGDEF)-like protein
LTEEASPAIKIGDLNRGLSAYFYDAGVPVGNQAERDSPENMLTMKILLLGLIGAAAVLAFFSGKRKGQTLEREHFILTNEDLRKKVSSLESENESLRKELEGSGKKAERYLYFLVRLPEAVKQINSNLSFDGLITATMRLTKDLTGAGAVEIYMFNRSSGRLHLVAAYGTNRENGIEIMPGEGLIGKAAQLKAIISRGHPGVDVAESEHYGIDTATPVLFNDSLLGAIAIGKMQNYTGNEKRFLAMLSDLMAVALNNIKYQAIANEQATRDALTGLHNKKYFVEKARDTLLSSENYDFPVSVLIFDIDHFKNYSDTNGHVQGDVVLRDIGKLLREHTRSTNVVARYGGEEFIILLENVQTGVAMACAENLRRLVESHPFPFRAKQPLGCLSISGGIATFPADGKTVDEIIRHAGEALYISKNAGGNRVTRYEPGLFSQAR